MPTVVEAVAALRQEFRLPTDAVAAPALRQEFHVPTVVEAAYTVTPNNAREKFSQNGKLTRSAQLLSN